MMLNGPKAFGCYLYIFKNYILRHFVPLVMKLGTVLIVHQWFSTIEIGEDCGSY